MRTVGVVTMAVAAWAGVTAAEAEVAATPARMALTGPLLAGPLLGGADQGAAPREGLFGGMDSALKAVIAVPEAARLQPLAADAGDGLGFHFRVQTRLDAWRRGNGFGESTARFLLPASGRFAPLRFQLPRFAPAALLGWSMQLASQLRLGIEAGAMTARMRAATLRDAVTGFGGEGRRMAGGTGRVQLAMRF